MSHTPGPWAVEHDGDSLPIITAQINGRWDFVAYLAPASANADAQLIAAAPELLSALRRMVETGESVFGFSGWPAHFHNGTLTEARAAIAKAEGK